MKATPIRKKASPMQPASQAVATGRHAWSHMELFDAWVASRAHGGPGTRERLTAKAAEGYRLYWNSFVRWLTTPQVNAAGVASPARRRSYTSADAADIDAFLTEGISTASPQKVHVSPITQVRYGSLLQWIYEFAANSGVVKHNPARGRTAGAGRTMRASGTFDAAGEGLVLNSLQWAAMLEAIPALDSRESMEVRDRAILLMLMDAHLTSGELCELDVSNVGFALEDAGLFTVAITEFTRRSQERSLELDAVTSAAIARWLEVRKAMALPAREKALFVTERRLRISKRVLIYVVARTMRAASKAAGFEMPYHSGPQVLRNSRIVFRLNRGAPVPDVIRDAGLKNHYSFRGLRQHLAPEIAKIVTPVARKERARPKS